jgi:hypothetical protein
MAEKKSKLKMLTESLKRNIFPEKEISNPNWSVSVWHPSRKEIDFSVEDSSGSGVNFDMYGIDADTALVGDRLIRRWRQVSTHPIPQECIEEIVNDAVVLEKEVVKTDTANLADIYGEEIAQHVEDSFEKVKELLDFRNKGDVLFQQYFMDGILPFEVVYDNKKLNNGIIRLDQLSPFGLRKVYQVDRKRFIWKYELSEGDENKGSIGNIDLLIPADQRFNNTEELEEEQIIIVDIGEWDASKMMFISPINKAMRSINQLHLIEDNLIMYRLTHSADVRVFHIDCGKLTKDKAEAYVARLKRLYEQKKYYNSSTGDVDEQKVVRVIGENFWFPKNSDGEGSSVEMLSGGNMDLGELHDLDHFIKQIYSVFGVPKTRRKSADDSVDVSWSSANDPNILREELNFSKKVRNYRRNFEKLFYEAIKRDLLAKKIITMTDWYKIKNKIDFVWESDNYYNIMKDFYILDQKLAILERIEPFIESGYFTKEWVVRNVLKMTRKEWEDMNKERETYRMKDIEFAKDREHGESGGFDMGGSDFGEGDGFEGDVDDEYESDEAGDMEGGADGGTEGDAGEGDLQSEFDDADLVADTAEEGEEAKYIKDNMTPQRAKNIIKEHGLGEGYVVRVNGLKYLVSKNNLIPYK